MRIITDEEINNPELLLIPTYTKYFNLYGNEIDKNDFNHDKSFNKIVYQTIKYNYSIETINRGIVNYYPGMECKPFETYIITNTNIPHNVEKTYYCLNSTMEEVIMAHHDENAIKDILSEQNIKRQINYINNLAKKLGLEHPKVQQMIIDLIL